MDGQVYGNCKGNQPRRARALRIAGMVTALLCAGAIVACDQTSAPPMKPAVSARAVDAAIQSAESYLAAQKPHEALQVAARLAGEAPTLMRAHELHARTLLAQALSNTTPPEEQHSWWEQAADAYDRAAALEPALAGLRHAAGVANSTAGRQEAAIKHYRAAHELEPGSGQFALYLGVALAHNDQLDEAQALLALAIQLAPNSPDPLAALADLALRRGDTSGARAHIASARALAPDSLPLRLADARIRRIDKHPEESVDMLMALDPPVLCEPGVAEGLALAHTSLGDFQAAAHALQASASANPADWRRAVRCADAWQRAGDPVRAQLWVQHALSSGAPASEFEPPEPRP